jgi:hypothetical protein
MAQVGRQDLSWMLAAIRWPRLLSFSAASGAPVCLTCQLGRMTNPMITITSMRLRTTWATTAGRMLRVRSVM